ncbi:hypothetical protein ACHQM5_008019 [Ranunculus cassubicifolius]
MLQSSSLVPVAHNNGVMEEKHQCTVALYSDRDINEQRKTYHCLTRLNQEFYKCAVYDSDDPSTARLIGVEYIVSDRIYHVLPSDEQKFWHSHAYEVKDNLWLNLRVIEVFQMTELKNLSKSYGKFWYTWQLDDGEWLPLGVPSLVMCPPKLPDLMNGISSEDRGRDEKSEERFITYVRRVKIDRKGKICASNYLEDLP